MDGIRLVSSLILGYPLAAIQRFLLSGKAAWIQHMYIIICGLALSYYNFGLDALHTLINTTVIYGIISVFGSSKLSVILSLVVNMGYVLMAYYLKWRDDISTITWSLPHCILTLRLTGLVWDLYDGHYSKKSDEINSTALYEKPALLEMCSFAFYYTTFLVGPQFSMRHYLNYINRSTSTSSNNTECLNPAGKKVAYGIIVLAIYFITDKYMSPSYLLSQQFYESHFLIKWISIGYCGYFTLYKYIAMWLLSEGSSILSGLGYNGVDENGKVKWDACTNMYLHEYITGMNGQQLIESGHVSANMWMSKYVYKRLKFLGSKNISAAVTMAFLSLWHGIYIGYAMCFGMEFLVLNFERTFIPLIRNYFENAWNNSVTRIPLYIICKSYIHMTMGYGLVPFMLYRYDDWTKVLHQMTYFPYFLFLGWAVLHATGIFKSKSKSKSTDLRNNTGVTNNNIK